MTPRVKKALKDYLQEIGGIDSIPKKDRKRHIKVCITALKVVEDAGMWDKMQEIYLFQGNSTPLILNDGGFKLNIFIPDPDPTLKKAKP